MADNRITLYFPGSFESEHHFYPRVLNAQVHPMVKYFFNMSHERIMKRYCHLNPEVNREVLDEILSYRSRYFHFGGADHFSVTTASGVRKIVVIETNSCPSGQKSLPSFDDSNEFRGYQTLIRDSFLPLTKSRRLPNGHLAVIADKNAMETTGYAAMIAELSGEKVYHIPFFDGEAPRGVFEDGLLYALTDDGKVPIRAAFRYVTQKPWNRIPLHTKSLIFNPILACLAGGRNKLLANKAYELYNAEISGSALEINAPETIRDVSRPEIPIWVKKFGGYAVIKNPYSNAGQGVYTVTSEKELDAFLSLDFDYDQFIVQSLIGHPEWSSFSDTGKLYHLGTVPNKHNRIYVADIRMMICSTARGFKPVTIYARRSRSPLEREIPPGADSWDILGTNLSIKRGANKWESDTSRLILMDNRDFNNLGIGLDDLVEGYIQTILSVIAIDKMAQGLMNKKGKFKMRLFRSLDHDESLINEILL